jgi:hypothetical protein
VIRSGWESSDNESPIYLDFTTGRNRQSVGDIYTAGDAKAVPLYVRCGPCFRSDAESDPNLGQLEVHGASRSVLTPRNECLSNRGRARVTVGSPKVLKEEGEERRSGSEALKSLFGGGNPGCP